MDPSPAAWLFCDAPYVGGAEIYLQWHLEAAGPERLGLIAVDRPALDPWLRARAADGFALRRLPPIPLRRRLAALRRLLVEVDARLFHCNLPGPYDGLYGLAPVAARWAGVPRVLVTEHLPGIGRVGKRYWAKRIGVRAVDRALVVCRAHRGLLSEIFGYDPSRVAVVPNGVPDTNPAGHVAAALPRPLPDDLAARERGAGPRLVQLGSLDLRKGGDLLVEAAARLRAEGRSFHLWFVGEGPDRALLEQRIAAAGLADRVHLAGHREDVATILAACHGAVLASRREGMPLSLLEALCHGLPAVACEVDGVGEVIEHGVTGLLVPPEDPAALARGLELFLLDDARRAAMGAAARRRYEARHTLAAMTAATFAHYGSAFDAREAR